MSAAPKRKVFVISLGCSKNLVDSEHMLGLLNSRGFLIMSRPGDAEICIINTCGFIQDAVEESIDSILGIVDLKNKGILEKVVVTGCFVQRYGYKLQNEIPEVDAWLGTGQETGIASILESLDKGNMPFLINEPFFLHDHKIPRMRTTPFYSAYVKIAEGCSHRCTYCIIPRLRGPFRSREPDSIIREVLKMADEGVKEINLIAQDSGMYGSDLLTGVNLADLLEKLVTVKNIRWIRIQYCSPEGVNDRLLRIMEREDKVCAYLDMPLQHVNRGILKAMGRNPEGDDPGSTIDRIRSIDRHVSIRTTFMVGFPGETDEIFKELYGFVKKYELDHMGAFIFSPEKGTPAARLKGIVDKQIARERLDALMGLQARISRRKNRKLIGQTVPVLIEGYSDETDLLLKGRTSSMAPDVDGQVLIKSGKGEMGEIVPVLITEAYEYDLIGKIVT